MVSRDVRLRDLGLVVGALPPGPDNAITDVPGVLVGHASVVRPGIRSGVTSIVPADDLYERPVRAGFFAGNGHGKVVGTNQLVELGQLETPVLLTGTLSTFRVADALVRWVIEANPGARSVNPVVGETNDTGWRESGFGPTVGDAEVFGALRDASSQRPEEGAVGAGTGTRAFGFKGGIGTASRVVSLADGATGTVGVLVQTNHGGALTVMGAPVGPELLDGAPDDAADRPGSVMVVAGTDLPLDARQLGRLARRAAYGLARTGAHYHGRSGDFAISFSTVRADDGVRLPDALLDPVWVAVLEAVDEAVLNSLVAAEDADGLDGIHVAGLPLDRFVAACQRHGLPAHLPGAWPRTSQDPGRAFRQMSQARAGRGDLAG
ncbi:MAG TPA: P1 family peptidase [Nitriliruptorales bacterium]